MACISQAPATVTEPKAPDFIARHVSNRGDNLFRCSRDQPEPSFRGATRRIKTEQSPNLIDVMSNLILRQFMALSIARLRGSKRARTRDQLLVAAQSLLMTQTAAALGIRQITDHAGVVHATFYNYYQDIAALIADLGELLAASHAATMAGLTLDLSDPALRFARITRQTLRMVATEPGLGRLIYDVGLPADSLVTELRLRLALDLAEGLQLGRFTFADLGLTASMVSGAISGLALDLHRGTLAITAIETATARLLEWLGLDPETAAALGHETVAFGPAPALPLRWLALPSARLPEGKSL
jgi:AcrR family transcriptional regulator